MIKKLDKREIEELNINETVRIIGGYFDRLNILSWYYVEIHTLVRRKNGFKYVQEFRTAYNYSYIYIDDELANRKLNDEESRNELENAILKEHV